MQNQPRQFFLRYGPAVPVLVLIIVLGAQLAHWTWVFFTPRQANSVIATTPTDVEVAVRVITAAHLFGSAAPSIGVPNSDSLVSNIQLKGVFAGNGQTPSYAIVNSGAKTDQTVRVGEEIQPGMKLKSVFPRHIIVNHEGVAKRVDLGQKGGDQTPPGVTQLGISPVGYNVYRVSRSDLSAALQANNAGIKLGQFSATSGGGLLVTDASGGSVAEKLGLQPGDVLRLINGQAVSSAADLSRLYQQFKQVSQIQLDLTRSGKPMQLRYSVQ